MRALRGFTLVELAVAVAILALAASATWRSFGAAQRGIGGQIARALAAEVALNRAAELRLGLDRDAPLPARVTQGGLDWDVTTEERATAAGGRLVTVLVSAPSQPGARIVVALGPAG